MISIFPTAQQARSGSLDNVAIHDEIRAIEGSILVNISIGQLECDVVDSPMTLNQDYYEVWRGYIEDRNKYFQMEQVIEWFTQLNYKISRIDDNGMMNWRIQW
jgi:hypothetical protein